MIESGFSTTDPITGTRTQMIESDRNGWVLEVHCPPGAPAHILEHVHLSWTETFEIVSGTAHYRLDRVQKSARAGSRIEMPAGQPHIHPWNAGTTAMVYRQINQFNVPNEEAADDVIGVFATINGLAREGKLRKDGLPKNPLQFAATLRTLVKHQGFDAKVPVSIQRFVAATLGKLAEGLGYRSSYPKYLEAEVSEQTIPKT